MKWSFVHDRTKAYLEVLNTLLDSTCVTDLEYFLFWFRPIKTCLDRKSKKNDSFSCWTR